MLSTAAVDFYCERLREGFGAEPLNMVTGLAFLVVGFWVYARAPEREDRAAAIALALVGVASTLQHGFALAFLVTLDIGANLLYLFLLGVLLLRRLGGLSLPAALAGSALAVAGAYVVGQSPASREALGPLADLFFLLSAALVVSAIASFPRHPATARRILLAACVLLVGLPFRFLDSGLCANWPYGTHGFWHLINAASAALLLAALARHRREAR